MSGTGNNEVAAIRGTDGVTARMTDAEAAASRARFEGELDLVEIIASQVSRSIDGCVSFDELLAAGREGLFDAACRYDPTKGASFRTFANYRVEGAIIDAVRKLMRIPKDSIAWSDRIRSVIPVHSIAGRSEATN